MTLLMPLSLTANNDEGLQQRLAQVAAQRADALQYRETRSSDLFEEPVEFRGRLEYDPQSGTLTKWVDSPEPARMTMDSSAMELQSGDGKTRRISLRRRPELAALVQALMALLQGDGEQLAAQFETRYSEQDDDCWTLRLLPLESRVARRVEAIEIQGQGSRLTQMTTRLADGEGQTMYLTYPVTDKVGTGQSG